MQCECSIEGVKISLVIDNILEDDIKPGCRAQEKWHPLELHEPQGCEQSECSESSAN
jgi:hypothetical protein